MTADESGVAIRRKRAIRSAIAIVFAIPPLAMFVLEPVPAGIWEVPWPLEWQVAFSLCLGISLLAGWEPVKASWTGEDREIYVDEPEVNDDW